VASQHFIDGQTPNRINAGGRQLIRSQPGYAAHQQAVTTNVGIVAPDNTRSLRDWRRKSRRSETKGRYGKIRKTESAADFTDYADGAQLRTLMRAIRVIREIRG